MRAGVRGLIVFAAVYVGLTAWGVGLAVKASQPRYHYEVRQDLSVHFDNADRVIEKVRDCLKRRQSVIKITYTARSSSLEDQDELARELMELACAETDRPDEGDYIGHQLGGYNCHFTEEKQGGSHRNVIEIEPVYFTDEEQEQAVDREVSAVLEGLRLAEDADDLTKAEAVYDYVCKNVEYDFIHRKNENYRLRSSAYGALCHRRATCGGYAVTVYRLLRELGVNCRVVTGTAAGEYHAWNIICINGRWYNADPTWDSLGGEDTYFLKCDTDFPDHEREDEYKTESFGVGYPMAEESLVQKGKYK
ncbi:transglutaminase-like domain-containing protein [Ruminococcus sp.]|uniref:transglutaminase domain-containing protein n=1 Tax=Ruminococcus sp. TaxID=41978 RepID=UPI0025DD7D5D|nr:transglutaminase-like domain-containing protein [Ruminococcus sp.]MBQ8966089.1 transglutaminase domain-containing protein [Ruminococcus sp.]